MLPIDRGAVVYRDQRTGPTSPKDRDGVPCLEAKRRSLSTPSSTYLEVLARPVTLRFINPWCQYAIGPNPEKEAENVARVRNTPQPS